MPGKVISVIQNPCMLQHAPIAECEAEYPLVIFSHGIGGNRIAYSAIICSLVRQVHQSFRLPRLPSFGFFWGLVCENRCPFQHIAYQCFLSVQVRL